MRPCKHSEWLSLSTQDGNISLEVTDRARTLVEDLPKPDLQRPSLFVFIGNNSKARALREIYSVYKPNLARTRPGEVHLHLDASTVFTERPILIADGDFNFLGRHRVVQDCHGATSIVIHQPRENVISRVLAASVDDLYFRLLSPFTDVFCFFSKDLNGGFADIVSHLVCWLTMNCPSTLPPTTYPHIVIVTEGNNKREEGVSLKLFNRIWKRHTNLDLRQRFAGIKIVNIFPHGKLSDESRHRRLKELLLANSDAIRLARTENYTLFSATHFEALFRRSCTYLCKKFRDPVDFIRMARLQNNPAPDWQGHLSRFLASIRTPEDLKEFAIPMIASTILLDSYPPDMHLFNPQDVFRLLYKDDCYEVARNGVLVHPGSTQMLLPSAFVHMVEEHLVSLFQLLCQGTSATAIHLQGLASWQRMWVTRHSDDTCSICLRRTPQYSLPCKHCLCENCIQSFGQVSDDDRWLFLIGKCFLCPMKFSGIAVRVKPPTASVRVLSIDGGGVRGNHPPTWLAALEEKISLPYPVQENFDVAVGTSSGGIMILALFINGWPVNHCIDQFEILAKSAFEPRRLPYLPVFSRIYALLMAFLTDGYYPVHNLEEALKKVFGSERSILDCSHATATGVKIGLPVTTIQRAFPCLFTNYNGVGNRPEDSGYHILRPKAGLSSIPVWEIARSASAAPFYFKAKHIKGLGTFQDGGLKDNGPFNIALQEVEALFPLASQPSLFVSLGTGSPLISEDVPEISVSRWWRDLWIFRLFRSQMSEFDPRPKWLKFVRERQRAGGRGEYFRFDIEIDGDEHSLDNTDKMQQLKAKAQVAISKSTELDRLARCMIAELFIFELHEIPRRENGKYSCAGSILCRLPSGSTALVVLMDQLSGCLAQFSVMNEMMPNFIDRSMLDKQGSFRQVVYFTVSDTAHPINILLKESSSSVCNISGSPLTLDRLVTAQGLDQVFGRADHRKRNVPEILDRRSSKRQRVV